ncbi:MAG TPA: PHB depolymerase family esterase [Candidatus Acidoferrum sp.]|nr:PHB depolymerase family esterase [Candidatus Acidoferrum sp.]
MKRYWLTILLAALLPTLALAANNDDETLKVGRDERHYLIHDYSAGEPTALVILLHGGGGSGTNMAEQTGFDAVAKREHLITVYPFGSGRLSDDKLLTWNAVHCCAYAMKEKIDDVKFLSQLIDHLIATRKVDPNRVYLTGLSNGGMMTHTAGIALHARLAAIAPVISSLWGDEAAQTFTLPVLIINGAIDDRVVPQGGELKGLAIGPKPADKPTLPITSQRDYWSKVNGCSEFKDETTGAYSLRRYTDCKHGSEVLAYVVNDNGHAWPGGTQPRRQAAKPTKAFDANEVIWEFFKQHVRQSAQ